MDMGIVCTNELGLVARTISAMDIIIMSWSAESHPTKQLSPSCTTALGPPNNTPVPSEGRVYGKSITGIVSLSSKRRRVSRNKQKRRVRPLTGQLTDMFTGRLDKGLIVFDLSVLLGKVSLFTVACPNMHTDYRTIGKVSVHESLHNISFRISLH
jgi:hypothetical protein